MSAPTLAFAGERGSFGEDAAGGYLGGATLLPVATFRQVFAAIADGTVDGGVVPIENVGQGTVREVYDLLLEHDLVIVGEVEVPVRLCLAALPGQTMTDITRVYSHAQALSQAEPFLAARAWILLASTTTSSAGAEIAARGERAAAAVLSPRAAALYGLEILAEDIQSVPRNRTRFLVLSREAHSEWAPALEAGELRPMCTTIAFGLANEPGTLLRALAVMARHHLNLSKLESRPNQERGDWEYVFWADLDGDLCAPGAELALDELREVTFSLRVMGCYPAAAPG